MVEIVYNSFAAFIFWEAYILAIAFVHPMIPSNLHVLCVLNLSHKRSLLLGVYEQGSKFIGSDARVIRVKE